MIFDLLDQGAFDVAWDLCEQEGCFLPLDMPRYWQWWGSFRKKSYLNRNTDMRGRVWSRTGMTRWPRGAFPRIHAAPPPESWTGDARTAWTAPSKDV